MVEPRFELNHASCVGTGFRDGLKPRGSGTKRSGGMRRGWSLISLIGALSIAVMVMAVCVPFYLSSHRLVERNAGQMRARELARELSSRFREDVRGARSATIANEGRGVNLETTGGRRGGSRVRYAWSGAGLVREVRGAAGQVVERMVYAEPLRAVRFRRDGSAVAATLEFAAPKVGMGKPLRVETRAAPRVEP